MATKQLELKYIASDHTYTYLVDNIQNVSDSQSKDAMSTALPGQSYRKNIMLGISGQEADISINFNINNDGTDKSNGSISASSSGEVEVRNGKTITEAVSVPEQQFYLKDVIQNPSFTAQWKINDPGDVLYNDLEVFFADIDTDIIDMDSPKWKSCRIDLNVGEGIG